LHKASTPNLDYDLDKVMKRHVSGLQDSGEHKNILQPHRLWLYMPYMHSEQLLDQEVCLASPGCTLVCTKSPTVQSDVLSWFCAWQLEQCLKSRLGLFLQLETA